MPTTLTPRTTKTIVSGGFGYYPFGMMQEGRQFVGGMGYRWGFGSQETDNEVSGRGNSYTAEFWQYDSRLGRRWNVDPVVKQWESSYSCFFGNPTHVIDPNGADGYIDERGYYLGDDGNKSSHETRIISSEIWKNLTAENPSLSDENRKKLTANSTLLKEYKKGILITGDTWDKLEAHGATRLNPWLENHSNYKVYAKSEDGSEVFEVTAGTSLYYTSKEKNSGIDGFAAPHLRPEQVVKVSTGTRVTVGDFDYSTSGGSILGSIGNFLEGGWKNETWLKLISADKVTIRYVHIFTGAVMRKDVLYNDKQWIPIFLAAGLKNAPEYNKYYEIEIKKWLID
jgi:hypothetical protein